MPLGALIFPWRMQNLLREYAASVAEKPQIHYPRTTNNSPFISNGDTADFFWVIPQQQAQVQNPDL